jgi:glucose/arabinose dehydrogenase
VRLIEGGDPSPDPFLDLGEEISKGGEQGLLGLAFHPDHADNGLLYVDFTDSEGDTRVVEYHAERGADRVEPGSARVLLTVDQPFSNHNGGHLVFGPDGMLYIGLGDRGSGGDPEDHGQRLDSLLGSILRIDVDGRDPGLEYAIPPDNPFVGREGARAEIWQYGLRNPWRFSFDPSGGFWIGDVGQNRLEEIDRVASAGGAGTNFGWNRFEGTASYAGGAPTDGHAEPPVAEYGHDLGCSVTGGHVYRGVEIPALDGRYVYGDYCSGRIWTLPADAAAPRSSEITERLGGPLPGLSSFGADAEGRLYVVAGGAVHRFTATRPRTP